MNDEWTNVAPRLYKRQYKTATGDWRTLFYANFVDWKGERRKFPLGSDLRTAKEELKVLEGRNVRREDFDADRVKPEQGMTVAKWSQSYFCLEEVKTKRSVDRDREMVKHLNRLLGDKLLAELTREDLFAYQNARRQEGIIRGGKQSKKKVADGSIKNELSLLRRLLSLARDKGLKASTVSFRGAIPEANNRERVLSDAEAARLFPLLPLWLLRLAEVARVTALSQGDLIRLTEDMIDNDNNVIVPADGRVKTGVKQAAPLTQRVREILDEIQAENRRSKIRNVNGLVFTRDGKAINKDMITGTLKRACRDAKIRDFRFHDLRHTAKTNWARQGISVDVAMLAAGQKSVQMHQWYVHLQNNDVAKAFGLCSQNVHKSDATKRDASATR
jgi:integrase